MACREFCLCLQAIEAIRIDVIAEPPRRHSAPQSLPDCRQVLRLQSLRSVGSLSEPAIPFGNSLARLARRRRILAKVSVRDLMTRDVLAVRPEDSLTKVQELMHEKDVRHAPVVDHGGTLVGLVSERDVLRRAFGPEADLPIAGQADQTTGMKAEDIMTCEVETVGPDEDAATAAQTMLDNKYGCLPVIEDGTLAGILTEADFVRFLTIAPAVERRTGGRKHRAGRISAPRIVK